MTELYQFKIQNDARGLTNAALAKFQLSLLNFGKYFDY